MMKWMVVRNGWKNILCHWFTRCPLLTRIIVISLQSHVGRTHVLSQLKEQQPQCRYMNFILFSYIQILQNSPFHVVTQDAGPCNGANQSCAPETNLQPAALSYVGISIVVSTSASHRHERWGWHDLPMPVIFAKTFQQREGQMLIASIHGVASPWSKSFQRWLKTHDCI